MAEISMDSVGSDIAHHADYQGFSVGRECLFYFYRILSFIWGLPCFFNDDVDYYTSPDTPLLIAQI